MQQAVDILIEEAGLDVAVKIVDRLFLQTVGNKSYEMTIQAIFDETYRRVVDKRKKERKACLQK